MSPLSLVLLVVIIIVLLGAHREAAEAILLWNKPAEIKARQRAEHQQFLNPQHTARA